MTIDKKIPIMARKTLWKESRLNTLIGIFIYIHKIFKI